MKDLAVVFASLVPGDEIEVKDFHPSDGPVVLTARVFDKDHDGKLYITWPSPGEVLETPFPDNPIAWDPELREVVTVDGVKIPWDFEHMIVKKHTPLVFRVAIEVPEVQRPPRTEIHVVIPDIRGPAEPTKH
jgi:hypothetical protein